MNTIDLIVFFVFIASVIGLGLFKSKGEGKDSESYFLAGRGLMWWLIGVSLIAANISSEQLVGMSGSAADYLGLAISSYEWMAAITLVVVAFFFIPYFLKTGIFTMPQFLEKRYGNGARVIMAFITMIMLVLVNLTGIIYAGGLTISQLFADSETLNLGLTGWCWVIGMIAAVYIAAGGLNASAWADLIQGIALVIGAAIITWFALNKLGATPIAELTAGSVNPHDVADDASGVEKLIALNHEKMHMALPRWDKNIPWTALMIGLWIPNFYYWGLNQYITQRVLGAHSLKEGQKGIVFAAGMKLIVPFVVVIPGIICFNLFSKDLAEIHNNSAAGKQANASYEQYLGDADSKTGFVANIQWARLHEEESKAIDEHNLAVLDANGADTSAIRKDGISEEERFATIPAMLTSNKAISVVPLQGYKYDASLNLMIKRLLPENSGLQGFVLAALFGAIVSSLAAVLNAASTIFTMDFYQRYINKESSQKGLVFAGRIAVGIFAVTGCLLAPNLDKFGSIFKYIQEFQGYISPGILAVFVFGMINRRAPQLAGVVGLCINPFLYGALAYTTDLAFLDAMAVCFFTNMLIMYVIGMLMPLKEPVEFHSNTTMDMTGSPGAKTAGIVVCIATVALYVIFW
ncbi:sodium:solute symporter family transporter [Persicirhabdus sediminis]|uniref:Sodium/solute symporter n=1 Tax=Persicirhabdus sediminis TaxID=454144 RepID=A0A8J7MGI2_9BACT|nr:sodium/solute symporter [Persicirhabdus sediminis]MBK1792627.1 sodium/solute symporter [Persicirhabdus sediminis]